MEASTEKCFMVRKLEITTLPPTLGNSKCVSMLKI